MRRFRILLPALLIVLLTGVYFTLRGLGLVGTPSLARVLPVPRGHQEIAWINAATSGSSWERFIAGVRRVEQILPELRVDYANAFPDQTTAVPEVVLQWDGCPDKIWIRWYKLTSDTGNEQWIQALAQRTPPPLAIIGGTSSDRARDLARVLHEQTGWRGPAPLLLITTATADKVRLDEEQHSPLSPVLIDQSQEPWRDLMEVYPGRSFRFCFTNRQMAEAVVDFVWGRPYLRPSGDPLPLAAGAVTAGDVWGSLAWLTADKSPATYALMKWLDDPYSIDLAERFREVLEQPDKKPREFLISYQLPFSVGDFDTPTPQENQAARQLLNEIGTDDPRHLLVLPASDKPARRFLRALTLLGSPKDVRNCVAVTGDAISFNTIYRDRDIAWNVQEMPMPVVLFAHQNPIAWQKPPTDGPPPSATDDKLLNADIVRILVEALYRRDGGPESPPKLLSSADELAQQLHARQPAFFDANGNRHGGSGEYVICLRPTIELDRVEPRATIEVWRREAQDEGGTSWKLVQDPPLVIDDTVPREPRSADYPQP